MLEIHLSGFGNKIRKPGRPSVAGLALAALLIASCPASAIELIKSLPCALTEIAHKGDDYCLKVFNTCNTPLITRLKDRDGYDKDGPEIPSGERGEVCTTGPFTVVGHYISGP